MKLLFSTGKVEDQVGVEKTEVFSMFPNPTSGNFYLTGRPEVIRIHAITGQEIMFTTEEQEDRTLVQLDVPNGVYIVRYTRGNITTTKKLVVTRHR